MNYKDELENRILSFGFKKEVSQYNYFRFLPNDMKVILLSLNKKEFCQYINFIIDLREESLLSGNEEKINKISNLLILDLNKLNSKYLMDLLVNTNILNNKDIVDFSFLFLKKFQDRYKLNLVYDYFSSIKNIEKIDIIKFIQNLIRVKTNKQLTKIIKITKISGFMKNRNFFDILNLIIDNPNSFGLDYIDKCIECEYLVNNINFLELIEDYLIEASNKKEANLIYKIITNKYMLKSTILFNLLYTIKKIDLINYFSIIEELVSLKPILDDNKFKMILEFVCNSKSDLLIRSVLYLLNYKNLLTNDVSFLSAWKLCTNLKYEYQFKCLKIILNKMNNLGEFDFFKGNTNNIINNIFDDMNVKDYQAISFANAYEYLIDSKKFYYIERAILNSNDKIMCNYIIELIKIENVQELSSFDKVLDEFNRCQSKNYVAAVLSCLENKNVINSNYYLDIIKIINLADEFYLDEILKLLEVVSLNLDTIKLIEIFSKEKDNKKHDLLYLYISKFNQHSKYEISYFLELIYNVNSNNYEEVYAMINNEYYVPETKRKKIKFFRK